MILDENLKPFVLEVNHTPSFSTDTPLDRTIKKGVIHDALKIMNISFETRLKCKEKLYREVEKRSLIGRKSKMTIEEISILKEKAQNERDEYEEKNLGGYEKIFPLSLEHEDMYEKYIQAAEKNYSDFNGTSLIYKYRNN